MTNLVSILASIVTSLSTNITTTDNRPSRWIPEPCPEAGKNPFYGCLVNHGRFEQYGEATEKTETEIVTEKKQAKLTIEGKLFTVDLDSKEISRVSRTYKLDQQWKLSEVNTNAPPWSIPYFPTNTPTNTSYLLKPDHQLEIVTNEAGLIVIRSK